MPIDVISILRPAFRVDGVARPTLDAGLLELHVEDSLTGPCLSRATFQNWGAGGSGEPAFLHFDRSVLDLGKPVRIDVATAAGTDLLFEGVVDSLEAEFPRDQVPRIVCCAVPTLHAFRSAPRKRSFPNQSDARVFKLIAGEHGLSAQVSLDSAPVRVPDQKKISDFAFVLSRARALGAEAWLDGNALHVHSSRHRPAAELTLTRGSNLIELSGTWGAPKTGRFVRGTDPFVVVAGIAAYDNALRTGRRIRLAGVGPLFDGQYYVTRTTHRFSGSEGFACAFDAERIAEQP